MYDSPLDRKGLEHLGQRGTHHDHGRVGLEHGRNLALRDSAPANDKASLLVQVKEDREISHAATVILLQAH
jgi:hypothetical protein